MPKMLVVFNCYAYVAEIASLDLLVCIDCAVTCSPGQVPPGLCWSSCHFQGKTHVSCVHTSVLYQPYKSGRSSSMPFCVYPIPRLLQPLKEHIPIRKFWSPRSNPASFQLSQCSVSSTATGKSNLTSVRITNIPSMCISHTVWLRASTIRLLLRHTAVQLAELLPTGPCNRDGPCLAAICIRLGLLVTSLHCYLLHPKYQCCTSKQTGKLASANRNCCLF